MSRWHSYLHSAGNILSLYKGEEPFAAFIKKYFSAHPKFGSSDRKHVSNLCYSYFRLGKALPELPLEEKIITAAFLCSAGDKKFLQELRPALYEKTSLPVTEKLQVLNNPIVNEIFPYTELSQGVDTAAFAISHLVQPDLFIRVRPGHRQAVQQKLEQAAIPFEMITDDCIALPNASKIDQVIETDKEAVIQDRSSQGVGEFLVVRPGRSDPRRSDQDGSDPGRSDPQRLTWDCCAASGGKSIMAVDILGELDLTVSDSRESILVNLKKRFAKAGIKGYKSFVADLTGPVIVPGGTQFDVIIADVPCTGSGTWSRTPEQLYYFDEKKIDMYAALQQKIVSHVIPHLRAGGYLLYVTCSVFKKENEEAVRCIKDQFDLQEIKRDLIKGYDKKADTLFACLLQKNL